MSAPRRWPTPAEQMRHGLVYGRRLGVSFDDAWAESWASLRWGNAQERPAWRDALLNTRPEFEAAWHGSETPVSRALAAAVIEPSHTTTVAIPEVAQPPSS